MDIIKCIMYEIKPGTDLGNLMNKLEKETPIRWVVGKFDVDGAYCKLKPTEFVPSHPAYLCMDLPNNCLFQRDADTSNSDLEVITKYEHSQLDLFIQAINHRIAPESHKEDNHEGMIYNPYTDDWSWF